MTMTAVTPEQAIEVLNRALTTDPPAIRKLFEFRTGCSEALANDPTIQVRSRKMMMGGGRSEEFEVNMYSLGALGLINGIFGVQNSANYGWIAAVHDVVCPTHGTDFPEPESLKVGDVCPKCQLTLQLGELLRFEVLHADP